MRNFVLVGRNLCQNVKLEEAIKAHNGVCILSNTGLEYINDREAFFVLDDFQGNIFHTLVKNNCHIYGPTVILQSVGQSLPISRRPLYCTSMQGVSVSLSKTSDPAGLSKKMHYMGGVVKKDMSEKVSHLITTTSSSNSYKLAMNMGKVIVREDWVFECWSRKTELAFKATQADVVSSFRWLPFSNLHLCFFSFSQQELSGLHQLTTDNDGQVADLKSCTHLVVNEESLPPSLPPLKQACLVVDSSWFWASIQMEACADVSLYHMHSEQQQEQEVAENQGWASNNGATIFNSPHFAGKKGDEGGDVDDLNTTVVRDKRTQTVMELCHTEHNYVSILNVLLDLYKRGLEDDRQPGGAILNCMETKHIFQGVVQLASLHRGLLAELREVVDGDRDSVGEVFNKRVAEMAKVYPSFVNFLQTTRQSIEEFRRTKPRFQAFLMLCQRRAECARQSLEDLMVRPVQRLPSILLLLKDILKRTSHCHLDHQPLQQAICSLDDVISHINEAKRKVDMHLVLFDVLDGIDGGQSLLSAHRYFVARVAGTWVGGREVKKMESLSLLLFNDCLAICRKKLRKEKFHFSVDLACVRKVIDVAESKNFKQLLSLIVDEKDAPLDFLTFNIEDSSISKLELMSMLLHHVSITTNTDQNSLLDTCNADDLNIDNDNSAHNSLKKTLRRMTRTLSLTKSSSSKKADDSEVIMRGGGWVSDESCRSSVDWSSSLRSCNSDKDNVSNLAGMLDETLVVSRNKTLANSLNELTSPLKSPTILSNRHAAASLRRPQTLIS